MNFYKKLFLLLTCTHIAFSNHHKSYFTTENINPVHIGAAFVATAFSAFWLGKFFMKKQAQEVKRFKEELDSETKSHEKTKDDAKQWYQERGEFEIDYKTYKANAEKYQKSHVLLLYLKNNHARIYVPINNELPIDEHKDIYSLISEDSQTKDDNYIIYSINIEEI